MTVRDFVQLPLDHTVEGQLPFIMALDPGGTTGWATFEPNLDYITCGQIGPHEHHEQLYQHLCHAMFGLEETPWRLKIAYESFQFRQFAGFDKTKVELWSVEYIGVIKLFGSRAGVQTVAHTASEAKGFVNDEKLKRLGWYKLTAGMPHARDGLRHLLYELVVTHKVREPFISRWLKQASS